MLVSLPLIYFSRISRKLGGTIAILASVAVVGGVAGPSIIKGITNSGGSGTASNNNLFVDTNGGSCTRQSSAGAYVDSQACSTFATACAAATAGDTVGVAAGNYPAQTITQANCPNTAPAIVFRPISASVLPSVGASANAPVINSACTNDCPNALNLGTPGSDCAGTNHDGPSFLTFQNFVINSGFLICGGHPNFAQGTNITLDQIDVGAFEASGVTNFVLKNSLLHDCWNSADFSGHTCLASQSRFWSQCSSCGPAGRATITATLTNDIFRNYVKGSTASHGECLFPLDIDTLVVQNSWFYNCELQSIQLEYSETPNSVIIQNNWFGRTTDLQGATDRCGALNFPANSGTITNTIIRYNSFADGEGITNSSGNLTSGTRIIGNIVGLGQNDSCAENTPPLGGNGHTDASVKSGNVWKGVNYGSNSVNVPNVTTLYINGTNLGSANYKLSGAVGSTVADNLVPCSSGDALLTSDKDGTARPQGTNCDAGSQER